MFYYVLQEYAPDTAQMNRALGNLRYLEAHGIQTCLVFLTPAAAGLFDDSSYQFIKALHLFKKYPYCKGKLADIIIRYAYPSLFSRGLKAGDTVYVYSCNEVIHYALKRKGVKVYYERTEHPECLYSNPLTSLSKSTVYRDCSKADGVFVISTCLRDFLISKGCAPKRVSIINMTVDPARFEGVEKQPSERYIAYCGSATNDKDGVDRLIKAFASIADKHKDVKLYVIGPKPNEISDNFNIQLISQLGISDRVVLTGQIDASYMPQMLKNAEVCALDRPDGLRAKGGFPTKLGEYLLSENPVVITSVGDIPLFLRDGESALLADPNNNDEFAEKLDWVLSHPEEGIMIGRAGKEVALKHFNNEMEAAKMIAAMKL